MMWGILDLSFKGYIVITLVLTQITIACVTLYLHRSQTHQAIKLHPIASHFFRFWLWLTTGIKTKEWVAVHRKHHAKCETPEDPHSPKNWGLKTMLFKGMTVYRAGKTKETVEQYGHGTPDDWIEKFLYSSHDKLGISLLFFIDIILLGLPGVAVWIIQMLWIPFWAAGVVNGVGHVYGYRNFETKDASTNIMPWAIFIGGEELHNNHHAFPSSAKLSIKWWEVDIGWFYIKILQFFKLAQVKRTYSVLAQEHKKSMINFDLTKIIINNRLQIMANYKNKVIIPSWKKERKDDLLLRQLVGKHAGKFIACSESILNDKKKEALSLLLARSSSMKLIYQFKLSLQQIWENNKLTTDEMVNLMTKWIEEAKKSGNLLLEKFADSILYYSVQERR